jgi:hypothetical protein
MLNKVRNIQLHLIECFLSVTIMFFTLTVFISRNKCLKPFCSIIQYISHIFIQQYYLEPPSAIIMKHRTIKYLKKTEQTLLERKYVRKKDIVSESWKRGNKLISYYITVSKQKFHLPTKLALTSLQLQKYKFYHFKISSFTVIYWCHRCFNFRIIKF